MSVQFSRNTQLLRSIHSFIKHLLNFDCELDTMLGTRDLKQVTQDSCIQEIYSLVGKIRIEFHGPLTWLEKGGLMMYKKPPGKLGLA